MRPGSDQAGEPPAGQKAGPAIGSPFAITGLDAWHGDLVAWLDRLDWLRTLSDRLTAVLGPVRERHQDNLVLELMHGGRWVGHPIHPALSDLPIGLWTGVMVLDAMDRDPAPRRGIDAAGLLSAAGILAAGATALTGLTDWTVSDDEDRRVGLLHGLLNTVALGLQGASLGTRMAGRRSTASALGAASLTVTAAAGYLGGHLVYNERIGVNHAPEDFSDKFVPVIDESKLTDNVMQKAMVDEVPVFVVRRGGRIFVMAEKCSHLGGPLSEGKFDGETVTCPWHNSTFAIADGRVLAGPAVYEQPCFEVRVRDGRVEARAARGAAGTAVDVETWSRSGRPVTVIPLARAAAGSGG